MVFDFDHEYGQLGTPDAVTVFSGVAVHEWSHGPCCITATDFKDKTTLWQFTDDNGMIRTETRPASDPPPRSVAEPFLLKRDGFPSPYADLDVTELDQK